MHVVAGGVLEGYWNRPGCAEAEQPIKSWCAEARQANWKVPADVESRYTTAVLLGGGMVSFALCGGSHRLIADINYGVGVVLVRFVGSAEEYTLAREGMAA